MLEDGCPQGLIWATGALRCTVRLIYRHCDLERTISEPNRSRMKLSVYAKSSQTGFQEHIAGNWGYCSTLCSGNVTEVQSQKKATFSDKKSAWKGTQIYFSTNKLMT